MSTIKVIIVEDEEFVRMGLWAAIGLSHSNIVIVGEAQTGFEFFKLMETPDGAFADMVLLDIKLPDISGFEIARRLKSEHPEMKILVISSEYSFETVERMVAIGIDGFISKHNSNSAMLIEAICTIMQGHEYFGKDIANIISQIYVAKKGVLKVSSMFTKHELQIIEYCHEGLTAKEIADRLCLTAKTINWHKANIFSKLGINSTREMVQFALKSGIIKVG
jgi:DNA-binding NarL/FixJ family response regulator